MGNNVIISGKEGFVGYFTIVQEDHVQMKFPMLQKFFSRIIIPSEVLYIFINLSNPNTFVKKHCK